VDASISKVIHREAGVRPAIAERLWEAARAEFSLRGYHGARVQGIARRAGCNVALLYRHWASKKALYLELLRSTWLGLLGNVIELAERGRGAPAVVGAYLDAHLRDPVAAQIVIRELLDGGPFLNQLLEAEPQLVDPLRQAARALAEPQSGDGAVLRGGLDPTLAVLTIGGLAALFASAHETTQPFLTTSVTSPEDWRRHLYDMLLHGILACPPK
jgi:TetR/AcrR family transcriptional regulator